MPFNRPLTLAAKLGAAASSGGVAAAGAAKSLDLNVFAEGVETEAQRAFLQRHDCKFYQGYLFGKPVAIEEFEALLGKL